MKLSKALIDKDVKAFKKLLFKKLHNVEGPDSWYELKKSVFKITNLRKYKSEHWRTGINFTYEFDIIFDMKNEGSYAYTTRWNKRHPRIANRYYKRYVENTIREIVKHFGVMSDDVVVVNKIVWDYLED